MHVVVMRVEGRILVCRTNDPDKKVAVVRKYNYEKADVLGVALGEFRSEFKQIRERRVHDDWYDIDERRVKDLFLERSKNRLDRKIRVNFRPE